jgi:hypothetical protein
MSFNAEPLPAKGAIRPPSMKSSYDKLSAETGFTIEELRSLGALYCYRHPHHEIGRPSEATAVLVAAAMRRAARGQAG